jgi:hypothetical protein
MKQTNKTTRNIALGFLSFCIMGISTPTFAGLITGDTTELKYIGKNEGDPVFQLNLNNSDNGRYLISIRDNENNNLYARKVSGINISKTYRIVVDEDDLKSDLFGVTIEVTDLDTQSSKVYKVSAHTKVKQDFLVAEF